MRISKYILTFVAAAMVTNVPIAYAARELPWGNFIPALVIIPIVLLWMVFSSKNDSKNDRKDSRNDKKDI